MSKYTKKPVTIEALQLSEQHYVNKNIDHTTLNLPPKWYTDAVYNGIIVLNNDGTANIKTLEGEHLANNDDYIIKGIQGELYPCKPDIFEATYNIVGLNTIPKKIDYSQIQDLMNKIKYDFVKNGEKETICTSYLGNFTVAHGFSACVDPAMYSKEKGEQYAKERCEKETKNKLWEFMGFSLFKELNPKLFAD